MVADDRQVFEAVDDFVNDRSIATVTNVNLARQVVQMLQQIFVTHFRQQLYDVLSINVKFRDLLQSDAVVKLLERGMMLEERDLCLSRFETLLR